jgi:hypothetical protein
LAQRFEARCGPGFPLGHGIDALVRLGQDARRLEAHRWEIAATTRPSVCFFDLLQINT